MANRVAARRGRRLIVLVAVPALLMLLLWQVAYWTKVRALDEIRARAAHELSLVVENLRGELAKFSFQPQLLSTDRRFADALAPGAADDSLMGANLELQRVAKVTGALDAYLMNADGRTVASSNWAGARSFVGRNFDYRPYFQEAMAGDLGRFFALGSTSLERGYYFAYPVRGAGTSAILGAVVVKMGVAELEQRWGSTDSEVVVLDPNGVAFLSTRPEWRLKSVAPLPPDVRRRLVESRRYLAARIEAIDVAPRPDPARADRIGASRDGEELRIDGQRYLALSRPMAEAGWRVVVLADASGVDRPVLVALLVAGLSCASLGLAAAVIDQRRRRASERLLLQEQARAELEDRVRERTRQFAEANQQLREEVAERERAETGLRRAQDELVQASKLAALGQMAAGLSHELSQPLGAIRGYADNARAFLDRDDSQTARDNLSAIALLTDRMARIIRNLRAFARKGPIELRPVRLAPVIADALALLETRRAACGAEVVVALPSDRITVIGGEVRLQQVLVNLISNGFNAMRGAQTRRLTIAVREHEAAGAAAGAAEGRAAGRAAGEVAITISDTGHGLAEDAAPRIFDPFFTTKEDARGDGGDEGTDEGMGLGLSISYSIVEQLGGRITAANRPEGGAEFVIVLRRAAPADMPAASPAPAHAEPAAEPAE